MVSLVSLKSRAGGFSLIRNNRTERGLMNGLCFAQEHKMISTIGVLLRLLFRAFGNTMHDSNSFVDYF